MTKTLYQNSPFGIASAYPWLTKADTKYNDNGVYKVGLVLSGEEAQAFKAKVDTASEASLERYFEAEEAKGKKVTPALRKQWKVYHPYSVEEDDAGNPTGYIEFRFKQNAKIKLKDGTVKDVKIAVMDASGKKEVKRPVFGGSELRIMFTFRDIVMVTAKEVGVQLAFGRVQVKTLAENSGGGGNGFDAVEGYTEGDEGHDEGEQPGEASQGNVSGDF